MNGPRIDLVRQAALSRCTGDFEWIDDRVALRVASARENQGFTAPEIRELAQTWIRGGGEIHCAEENRPNWRNRRDYYYWIIIEGIDEFHPRGLFVEMELTDADETDPLVSLLNAHPPTFP
ncbi:MAG: hypothetical protein HYS12_02055 [Planctomycetes bacterium]|nr:hypothetical protein [Planctomycetota bacterium]